MRDGRLEGGYQYISDSGGRPAGDEYFYLRHIGNLCLGTFGFADCRSDENGGWAGEDPS